MQSASAARAETLLHDLVARLSTEPDLGDFLGWWGGTLEYWIHICAASVARRSGWSARSEVPYVTAAPASTAKTPIKWADGAVVWPDGQAVLLEVKTIPYRSGLGGAVSAIPSDLAALVAADWPATLAHNAGTDRYTDSDWWTRRHEVRSLAGIQIALVHGRGPMPNPDTDVSDGIEKGIDRLHYRYRNAPALPAWTIPLRTALHAPVVRETLTAGGFEAVLYAWVAPVPATSAEHIPIS